MKSRKMKKSERPVGGSQPEEMYGLATRKNMFLDRPTSHGGWPEGEYDPPINDRIYNYLKSMGLINEHRLRSYIRNIIIENDRMIAEDPEGGEPTDPSYWREVGKTTSKYKQIFSNPTVMKEVEAWSDWIDDWAGRIGIVLTGLGLGAATIASAPVSVPTALLGGAALLGFGNSVFQGSLALQKGDYTAAGGHALMASLDIALGSQAENIVSITARAAGSSAEQSVRAAQQVVTRRNLGLGVGQNVPHTRSQIRNWKRSQLNPAQQKAMATTLTGFGGGTIAGVIFEVVGNVMIDAAEDLDDARRGAGLQPQPELTRETREMGERLAGGSPTADDLKKLSDALDRIQSINPSYRQKIKVIMMNAEDETK